ncbi:MAG: 16S rRNA (cytosine(1402)-N(4))-methyltransferase RsmH [Candidatus Nealsonbacteria bacterium]|nr:16S rRNA (cytosine(1402)-N(4))-methyltransferase RsmH [Candidatus Nealsonbacteria bacterium]
MHIPVLKKEVIQYLDPKPNENFIDATIGNGGHSLAILEKTAPKGKVLGIDWSQEMIDSVNKNPNLIPVCANFADLSEIVRKNRISNIRGILFDLGMSSWHLASSGRGFSLQKKEPLDMRYSLANQLTAEKIVNYFSKFEIEKILREYGEEEFSKEIAEKIVEKRKSKPIENTLQLVEAVKEAVPRAYLRRRIHPATRTFQALRIAVNGELDNIEKVLPQALSLLETGGRLVVISFHSLEDRIVKNFFKNRASEGSEGLKILTKKPIIPTNQEIKINPKSRSAKLRVAVKI